MDGCLIDNHTTSPFFYINPNWDYGIQSGNLKHVKDLEIFKLRDIITYKLHELQEDVNKIWLLLVVLSGYFIIILHCMLAETYVYNIVYMK